MFRLYLVAAAHVRGSAAALCLTVLTAGLITLQPQAATAAPLQPERTLTAWIPNWDQERALRSFVPNAELFAYVSPFWYELAATGSIDRYAGAEDAGVLADLRATGVPIVPTITNGFDPVRTAAVLRVPALRSAHVAAIVDLVLRHDYAGIDVDYESMAAAERDVFSAFLRELGSALDEHQRLLTVAVHPKTSDSGTWSGPQSHDYSAIGAAADRVRVMAYGHSWSTSAAGPIAPLPWVRAVTEYATSRIPAAKVELGLNLYGRDWVGTRGEAVTHDVVVQLMRTHGALPRWDASTAEPSFTYSQNGLDHTVHYADARSVAARLALVDELGLAGAALWRLGREDPALWTAARAGSATSVPAPQEVTSRRRRHLRLSWQPSPGVTTYRVLRRASPDRPWVPVADVEGTTWSPPGVPLAQWHSYAVQAVGAAGATSAAVPATLR